MPDRILVDICGTLYKSNTTFDFLSFYLKSKPYKVFRIISRSIFWRILNKLLFSKFHIDLTRIIAVSFLRGSTINELKKAMEDFYMESLTHLKINSVLEVLEYYKTAGTQIILVSATLDFIAEKIASSLDIKQWYATELVYKNDVCVGRISRDLLNMKLPYLQTQNVNPPFSTVLTDNFTDLDLVIEAKHAIIVTNNRNLKYWKSKLVNHSSVQFILVN